MSAYISYISVDDGSLSWVMTQKLTENGTHAVNALNLKCMNSFLFFIYEI